MNMTVMGCDPCKADQVSYWKGLSMLLLRETYTDLVIPIIRKDLFSRKALRLALDIFLVMFGSVMIGISAAQIYIAGWTYFSMQGIDEIVLTFLFSVYLGIHGIIMVRLSEIMAWLLTNPLSENSNLKFVSSLLIFMSIFTCSILLPLDLICSSISRGYYGVKDPCKTGFDGGRNERIILKTLKDIGIFCMLDAVEKPNLNDESVILLGLILVHYAELTDHRLNPDQLTRFVAKGSEEDGDIYLPIPEYLDEGLIIGEDIDFERQHYLRIDGTELTIGIPFTYKDIKGIRKYLKEPSLERRIDLLSKHLAGILGRFYIGSDDEVQHAEMRKVIDRIWIEACCGLIRGNVMLFQFDNFAYSHPDKFYDHFDEDMLRCDRDNGSYRFTLRNGFNLNNLEVYDLMRFINASWINIIPYHGPRNRLRDLYNHHYDTKYVETKGWEGKDANDPEVVRKVMSARHSTDNVHGGNAIDVLGNFETEMIFLDLPTLRLRDTGSESDIVPFNLTDSVYMVPMVRHMDRDLPNDYGTCSSGVYSVD